MTMERVGVVGAGTMGNGIAQVCAAAGLQVVMVDVAQAAVQRGLDTLAASLARQVKKGSLGEAERRAAIARVRGTTDYDALRGCQIVIEAATENLALKLRILCEIEQRVDAQTVMASNTSSISITQLAAVLQQPQRCIGMHFFNPVPVMGLVELIRGLQTGDAAQAAALALARRIGKQAVNVRNSPGFAVNRVLVPMLNEAVFVLQEGIASAGDIDAGMCLGCNHPIGPLALADLIGLDTLLSVMQVFYDGFKDPKYRPAPLLAEMVAAGRLGRKSGRGFYDYA